MPLNSKIVGEPLPPVDMLVTPRVILAYSAGIGDDARGSFDDSGEGFAASPFFCVTPEWQFVIQARNRDLGLAPGEAVRGVHAGQTTRFFSRLRPGRRIRVTGAIVRVRQTRAGALSTTRMDITDLDSGEPVSSTLSDGMYRDVRVEGGDRSIVTTVEERSPHLDRAHASETAIPLDRWFAHRYTECAAIWNPIHTEQGVARPAGLPGTIVHGTALWALAGKTIVADYAGGNAGRLQVLSGRFSAMVPAGEAITICHAPAESPGTIAFVVRNEAGREAISNGFAKFAPA